MFLKTTANFTAGPSNIFYPPPFLNALRRKGIQCAQGLLCSKPISPLCPHSTYQGDGLLTRAMNTCARLPRRRGGFLFPTLVVPSSCHHHLLRSSSCTRQDPQPTRTPTPPQEDRPTSSTPVSTCPWRPSPSRRTPSGAWPGTGKYTNDEEDRSLPLPTHAPTPPRGIPMLPLDPTPPTH